MARPLAIIENELRSLSTADKEALLRVLREELDGPADPDVEAAWLDEAERRTNELDSGTVRPISAEEVFAKIRADLKK